MSDISGEWSALIYDPKDQWFAGPISPFCSINDLA